MSNSQEVIQALDLAIANNAEIHGLLGASYPNGPEQAGSNRDIPLNLDADQSKQVYQFLKELLEA